MELILTVVQKVETLYFVMGQSCTRCVMRLMLSVCFVDSGEYSTELHAAGIPALLTLLATELTAQNIDCVQVSYL